MGEREDGELIHHWTQCQLGVGHPGTIELGGKWFRLQTAMKQWT
jgi:hypothetical protein